VTRSSRSERPREPQDSTEAPLSWPRRAALWIAGGLGANLLGWLAAIWIGAAGVFLSIAWSSGPQGIVDAMRYKKFTGQVDGTIVESWLAIELDPREVPNPSYWRASALASACEVVEYRGEWSAAAMRRAFCGIRLKFSDQYTLAGVRELTFGAPFRWPRDAHGFIVPEVRIDEAARAWLAAGKPVDTFMHGKRGAKNMLDELRYDLDEPVDAAIAGWLAGAAPPIVPLAFDPGHPESALPAAVVKARATAEANWFAVIVLGAIGLALWFKGMSSLPFVAALAPVGRWILMILPLAALPWWGTYLPRAISNFNAGFAEVFRDMLSDVNLVRRFVDSAPEEAPLARGSRIVFEAKTSVYADTLGRFDLKPPVIAPSSDDAALAMLGAALAAEVSALADAEKAALFARLKRDVDRDLDHAGIAFFPAAKATIVANPGDGQPARAARAFLEAWSGAQHGYAEEQPAQKERARIEKDVAAVR